MGRIVGNDGDRVLSPTAEAAAIVDARPLSSGREARALLTSRGAPRGPDARDAAPAGRDAPGDVVRCASRGVVEATGPDLITPLAQEPHVMLRHRIRRGLDLALDGSPSPSVDEGAPVRHVGVRGADVPGVRPRLRVAEGARVRLGDVLFEDHDRPEVVCTSPGAGVVRAIHRGERRALTSVVIALDGELDGRHEGSAEGAFEPRTRDALASLPRDVALRDLLASGLFLGFRSRPFGRVPDPAKPPRSIFVTATATAPLAARPADVIATDPRTFEDGLAVVARLTTGPVYLCRSPDAAVPTGDPSRITVAEFSGPHPAGLAGTHIHHLDPVGPGATVWHIGYQDVMAIGACFATGRRPTHRVVAVGGPRARRPRLVRTRVGAALDELLRDEIADGGHRTISGSPLSGDEVRGPTAFLGRLDVQVTLLPPAASAPRDRPVMLPLPCYERVVPLNLPVAPLLRALLAGDVERAADLGALELVEEDLALCAHVCPGHLDYGGALREVLDALEAGR